MLHGMIEYVNVNKHHDVLSLTNFPVLLIIVIMSASDINQSCFSTVTLYIYKDVGVICVVALMYS